MGRPWVWREYDEEGLRFALLMTHHELRDLAARLAAAREHQPSQAALVLAQYHQAYRDLTAVLAAVPSEELDRAPAEGEWPVREVCKHMLGAEYGFLRVCKFGLLRRRAANESEPSEQEWDQYSAPYVAQRDAAVSSLDAASIELIRDALAEIHIRVLRELGDISDGEIDAPAWFWDGPKPIRFRLHRFEEHLRQHTIQLDKTLAGIGQPPTEAQRLVRNIYNALADVETERTPGTAERDRVAQDITERAAALPV